MKDLKHTPGPWYSVEYGGFYYLQTTPFYDVDNLLDDERCEQSEHNAKLAAAAPDLLAFAMEMVQRYPNSPWILEQGNAAIAKALPENAILSTPKTTNDEQ